MIQHYVTIAIRNLVKYKIQSLVSIIGLAIGLVSFTFGYYWYNYETSYDGFYPASGQIYRIAGVDTQTGKLQERMPLILARKLKQEFPEVKETTQLYSKFGSNFHYGETYLGDVEELFIDEQHFDFFPPTVVSGREKELLRAHDEIVITRSFAKKYWKTPEEAIGKTLRNGYRDVLNIVAVVEDPPKNSLLQTEVYELDKFDREMEQRAPESNQWKLMDSRIYLLLNKQADAKTLGRKIEDYMTERKYNEWVSVRLLPLTDIRHTFGSELSFNISYIRTFAITTLLLLFCVFFNFANLLLNRIYRRSKEMKLRTALGAGKKSLVRQLLTELSLQWLLAVLLGYCLLEIFTPAFGSMFETEIQVGSISLEYLVIGFASWCILVMATLPVVLHFIRSSSLLLSGGITANRKSMFRKASIVIQLCIGVFFLVCTLIIGNQISFMKHKDLGFNTDNLIVTTMTVNKREEITHEIAELSSIRNFSPGGIFSITHAPNLFNEVEWEGKESDFKPGFQLMSVGEEFISAFQLHLKEGRFITSDDEGNGVVINEEAARIMGMQQPIGKKVSLWRFVTDKDGNHLMTEMNIVGVINNFQSASLHNPICPQIIQYDRSKWRSYFYYLRVTPGTEQETIQQIRKIYRKHHTAGDKECNASTMNQVLDKLNSSENASLQLFTLLAILCTLISLFGIYSISSGNMEQRRKEIAVRKVMGASSKTIIGMFFREYLLITFMANLVSLPLAWLFMQRWLEQYPYRAGIPVWIYISVFAGTSLLILLSVLWQTLRAAEANPADVVRSE